MKDWAGRFQNWRELRRRPFLINVENIPILKVVVKVGNDWRQSSQVERSIDKSNDTVVNQGLGWAIQKLARAPPSAVFDQRGKHSDLEGRRQR